MRVPIVESCHNYIRYSKDRKKRYYFYRFSVEQSKIYDQFGMFSMMSKSGAGIYFSFNTTGSKVVIKYKLRNVISGITRILKDTGMSTCLDFLKEIKEEKKENNKKEKVKFSDSIDVLIDGNLVFRKKLIGKKIKIKFENKNKEIKHVQIYLPTYFEVGIKVIKTNGEVSINHTDKKKILCLGDSITQGFIAAGPSETYVMKLAHKLHAYALNQGIGSYEFFYKSLQDIKDYYQPNQILIAYGTNDWFNAKDEKTLNEQVASYFLHIVTLYPNVPMYVVSPIYREDKDSVRPVGGFDCIHQIILKETQKYANMEYIDGMSILPHEKRLFADGFLHPTSEGFEYMSEALAEYMKK